MTSLLQRVFHLQEYHTDVKTEVVAGITTFMTMAYILAVNPSVLAVSLLQQRFPPAWQPF